MYFDSALAHGEFISDLLIRLAPSQGFYNSGLASREHAIARTILLTCRAFHPPVSRDKAASWDKSASGPHQPNCLNCYVDRHIHRQITASTLVERFDNVIALFIVRKNDDCRWTRRQANGSYFLFRFRVYLFADFAHYHDRSFLLLESSCQSLTVGTPITTRS